MATGLWAIFLGNLDQLGFFQFLLPFLLVLAIVYGVLRYAAKDILDKSASGLISIVIAFFFMNYSGDVGVAIADFFTNIFGGAAIIFTGILVVIILLGLLGIKFKDLWSGDKIEHGTAARWVFVVIIIFVAFLIALGAGGAITIPTNILGMAGQDVLTIVFFIIVLALGMWWMSRGGDNNNKND